MFSNFVKCQKVTLDCAGLNNYIFAKNVWLLIYLITTTSIFAYLSRESVSVLLEKGCSRTTTLNNTPHSCIQVYKGKFTHLLGLKNLSQITSKVKTDFN